MRCIPLNIAEPQIEPLSRGSLTELRRPSSARLEVLRPGDILWIREPFHLPARCDWMSPTQAIEQGAAIEGPAVPVFVADAAAMAALSGLPSFGRRRAARELPRAIHRQHLVLTGLRRELLQDANDDAIRAEGFASRADYARAWDANLKAFKCWDLAQRRYVTAAASWADNPVVLVLSFVHIPAPVHLVTTAATTTPSQLVAA